MRLSPTAVACECAHQHGRVRTIRAETLILARAWIKPIMDANGSPDDRYFRHARDDWRNADAAGGAADGRRVCCMAVGQREARERHALSRGLRTRRPSERILGP